MAFNGPSSQCSAYCCFGILAFFEAWGMATQDESTLEDWTVAFNIRAMIPENEQTSLIRHFYPLQEPWRQGNFEAWLCLICRSE